MNLNEREQEFVRQAHREFGLQPMADLRRLGCPNALYERMIEQRAGKIAGKLAEFRGAAPTTETLTLEQEIASHKLF